MTDNTKSEISYVKEFIKSPWGIGLAILTIGLGFLTGHWFWLTAGVIAYCLGVMFLHDCKWFSSKVNGELDQKNKLLTNQKIEEFKLRRRKYYESLTQTRRTKYDEVLVIARDIEKATSDSVSGPEESFEARLQKIDELVWTYLKLLCIEQSLERFITYEKQDDVPEDIKKVDQILQKYYGEITELKKDEVKNAITITGKERLLASYKDQREVLEKRIQRLTQAESNMEIVDAEEQRLTQQIKLIRGDAIAARNTDAISARIDDSIAQLGETNKWIDDLTDFKDIVADVPDFSSGRIGLDNPSPENERSSNAEDIIKTFKTTIRRGGRNYERN